MLALVIDDSRTIRTVIRAMVQEIGLTAIEAADGQEGLTQLRQHPNVELILVDWNMPVMNGLEFIRAVRAEANYNAIRIMMVTTETEMEKIGQALEAGANEYLMKPFTKEVLVAKLNLLDVYEE